MRKCKIYKRNYQENYWHFKTKYFIYHNVGHITTKYPKKSNSVFSFSLTKKKLCYIQKVTTQHLTLKTKVGQVFALYLVKSYSQKFLAIFVIINSKVTDHFFGK